MKLITSSRPTPVCVAIYESGALLCQISLGVGTGARLEHVCITHHLNILLILFYHIPYTTFSFHATICIKIICCPFIAAPCRSTRECIYDASNRNHGFPPIVGPWADNWGHSRHMLPRRYQKRAHGRIFGDFFREPAQGRIFEWALLRGLPVCGTKYHSYGDYCPQ